MGHTTVPLMPKVRVIVAAILTMVCQAISWEIPIRLRPKEEGSRNRQYSDREPSGADSPDRTEKMEESRGSRAQPVSEAIHLNDDDGSHLFAASKDDEDACKEQVLLVLDDICPSHLDVLAKEHAYNAQLVLGAIMDKQEKGEEYPRRSNPLKRKWDEDSNDDNDAEAEDKDTATLQAKIDDPSYAVTMSSQTYKTFGLKLISQDFDMAPKPDIKRLLSENGSVLRTYAAMDDARRSGNQIEDIMWTDKKNPTPALPEYAPQNIAAIQRNQLPPCALAALDEFLAARVSRNRKDAASAEEAKELANIEQAKSRGEMGECGCCFDDVPLNRMVRCASENEHFFCRECLKRQAETQVGYQKYELTCMATEGCDAGFSIAVREASLNKKLKMALDRIEQQAVLDMAGLEDLETCPFCPYAMEYPPVEVNKEFRCENPSCRSVSCRLCRKTTHIPQSCAEAAQDEAQNVRHTIEEAMSEAMIRKCNNCKNPFIKHDGCNKISCTRCYTTQCYICRQTVDDYSHFNDTRRGGKAGQCPLFDATEERHQNEVQRAEEDMRKKVTQERPDLIGDVLKLKMSSRVEDDQREKKERDINKVAAQAAARARVQVRRPRYLDLDAEGVDLAPEMVRPNSPDPPNVRPRPEDARGPRVDPGAGPGQPPAVIDAPPVQRPASNPNPAAVLPLQPLQYRQQQAQELAPGQEPFGYFGYGGSLLQHQLVRGQIPAADGRHDLLQVAQPQAASRPAAWPQGNQHYGPPYPGFPHLGALVGAARPRLFNNVQLQPPAGPGPMWPGFLTLAERAQQQAQQRAQQQAQQRAQQQAQRQVLNAYQHARYQVLNARRRAQHAYQQAQQQAHQQAQDAHQQARHAYQQAR